MHPQVCEVLIFLTSKANFLPARKAAILFFVFIRGLVVIGQSLCCFPRWLWRREEEATTSTYSQKLTHLLLIIKVFPFL